MAKNVYSFVDPDLQEFVEQNDEVRRRLTATKILEKYPESVPVIVGRGSMVGAPRIIKNKFIVPGEKVFTAFMVEIRKHLDKLNPNTALFYFVGNNIIPPSGMLMSEIYKKYKTPDGFLYITYAPENTFGNF